MKTCAFINLKGGTGKTACADNIGHIMATKYNKRVLMIDMDPQSNTTTMYRSSKDNEEAPIISRIISWLNGNGLTESPTKSIEDILLDSKCNMDIHEAIFDTEYDNIDLIPAYITLASAELNLTSDVTSVQQTRLRKHLKAVENEYDYCIIDCSPTLGISTINALYAADEVYIPMKNDAYSLEGACVSMNIIKNVMDENERLKIGGIFITQNSHTNVNKMVEEFLDTMLVEYKIPVSIRNSVKISEATYNNVPLLEADKEAKQPVTQDYIAITEYILNK